MSQHHVNPDLIHRTAWGNPLWNALHNLNITGLCLAGSIITALIWPLALPVCLLFTLVTSVIFTLQRWRCPLRMPMTLSLDDPSQDRNPPHGGFFMSVTAVSMISVANSG